MTESIFRSSAFRRFYAGQALSYVGDGLRTLAIPLLVFHLTGSAVSLGITFALELLPFAVFSLVGGSLADRLDRRRLMIGCDALRFAIMVLFVLALWRGFLSLTLIYAGVALLAVCGAVFLGAQSSSIPYMLGKDRAKAAVAASLAFAAGAIATAIAEVVTRRCSTSLKSLTKVWTVRVTRSRPTPRNSIRSSGAGIATSIRPSWRITRRNSLAFMRAVIDRTKENDRSA